MNLQFTFLRTAAFSALFAALVFAFSPTTDPVDPAAQAAVDSTNVLEDALKINGPDAPKPPDKFNPGSAFSEGASSFEVESKDYGFSIKFPSGSLVPSPTVHDGKLYTGGGFSSTVYHCFDAKSGTNIWSKAISDDGPSSSVIERNTVVFNTESCTIFALDAGTGQMKWSWYMGDPMMSMPAIIKGKVITCYPASYGYSDAGFHQNNMNNHINPDGNLKQDIAPADQAEEKHADITARIRPDHVLACLDLETGKVLWQKWIDGDVMSAPVGAGTDVMITTFPGTTWRFNIDSGEILAANAIRATSAPVVVNGTVFTSRRYDGDGVAQEKISEMDIHMVETSKMNEKKADYLNKSVQVSSSMKTESAHMDANNGFGSGAPTTSGWTNAEANIGQSNVSSLQSFQGSRVLNYRGINYSCMGDELIANEMKTGDVRWKVKMNGNMHELGGFLGTPPVIAGGKIIIATIEGDVILFDPVTGTETARYQTGHPIRQQPVVDSGWIYASSSDGFIFGINTKDPNMTGWPVWGHDNAHSGVGE